MNQYRVGQTVYFDRRIMPAELRAEVGAAVSGVAYEVCRERVRVMVCDKLLWFNTSVLLAEIQATLFDEGTT